jgi:hypothetical protein
MFIVHAKLQYSLRKLTVLMGADQYIIINLIHQLMLPRILQLLAAVMYTRFCDKVMVK